MSWFSSWLKREPSIYKTRFQDFARDYPRAMEWVKNNGPHKTALRVRKDKKGRWGVQIVDESPTKIGNRNVLGVSPVPGYGEITEADTVACVLQEMDEKRVSPRIFTDRNGKYRWRLVNLLTDGTEDIIQNTAGASFNTELEARQALGRVLFAE